MQTEMIEMSTKWTQYPPDDFKGCGGKFTQPRYYTVCSHIGYILGSYSSKQHSHTDILFSILMPWPIPIKDCHDEIG